MILTEKIKTFEKTTGYDVLGFLPEGITDQDLDNITFQQKSLSSISGEKGTEYTSEGCLGQSFDTETYFAILKDGSVREQPQPDYEECHAANNISDKEFKGIPLLDGWSDFLGEIKYIVKYCRHLRDWPGNNYESDRYMDVYIIKPDKDQRKKEVLRQVRQKLKAAKLTDLLVINELLRV